MKNVKNDKLLEFVEVAAGQKNPKEAYNIDAFDEKYKDIAVNVLEEVRALNDETNEKSGENAVVQMRYIRKVLNDNRNNLRNRDKLVMFALIERGFVNGEKVQIKDKNVDLAEYLGYSTKTGTLISDSISVLKKNGLIDTKRRSKYVKIGTLPANKARGGNKTIVSNGAERLIDIL